MCSGLWQTVLQGGRVSALWGLGIEAKAESKARKRGGWAAF